MAQAKRLGDNLLLLSDSYKVSQHVQYPPGTSRIYSYFECRGGKYESVCFFGLQYYLKAYLAGTVVSQTKIDEADVYFRAHFGHPVYGYDEKIFNRKGWQHIVEKHGGRLPVSIKAVPEGTVLPYKNVLFTMENTDDACYWLVNYLETLLVQTWSATTVCTQSRAQKMAIMRFLRDTGTPEVISQGGHLFKLHDFGLRGVSSVETAATAGCGHLVNFLGTDNLASLVVAKEIYNEENAPGFSIPASEHSTITSWGKEREVDAMRNMLEKYPRGIVACVSDSYDVFRACTEYWGTTLKAQIERREGCLVVRPDSGELPGIVLQVLEALESKFGSTKTPTGHKVLPPYIRVIQGDGINPESLEEILQAMADAGFAADNLAFGSGGALLQKVHRDTQKCAFKCSYAVVAGKGVDVVKDPITDPGKKSKLGRLTLERDAKGEWVTVTEGKGKPENDHLVEVFRDGKLLVDQDLRDIRARAALQMIPVTPLKEPLLNFTCTVGDNILLQSDSYKVTHHLQYPPNTTKIYSYFECRGGLYEDVVFFGLQYILKRDFVGQVVTPAKIEEAHNYARVHFTHPVFGYDDTLFNKAGWQRIVDKHGGCLPVKIRAVPEGTVVKYKNVLFVMENTDPELAWLTNFLETRLVQVWYPVTVATQSREQKRVIMSYLRSTGTPDVIDKGLHLFKLHDFGFRGVSSVESAAVGGSAHLVNFLGSDTLIALRLLKEYYGESAGGFSIPASEHSTMTSWGKENEVGAMRNMLEMYPKGIIACVSDSFDIFHACTEYWGTQLKGLIEGREGCLVVRPDSGKLPDVVVDVLKALASKFEPSTTPTGHKLLPPCIRVIQGDGICYDTLAEILKAMADAGFAADNLAFGSGGALLQKLDRDTQKCAFKCSYAIVDGKGVDVVKDPITDSGKKSKKGLLSLEKGEDGLFVTKTEGSGDPAKDCLVDVFCDGKLLIDYSFADIRKRAEIISQ